MAGITYLQGKVTIHIGHSRFYDALPFVNLDYVSTKYGSEFISYGTADSRCSLCIHLDRAYGTQENQ